MQSHKQVMSLTYDEHHVTHLMSLCGTVGVEVLMGIAEKWLKPEPSSVNHGLSLVALTKPSW